MAKTNNICCFDFGVRKIAKEVKIKNYTGWNKHNKSTIYDKNYTSI